MWSTVSILRSFLSHRGLLVDNHVFAFVSCFVFAWGGEGLQWVYSRGHADSGSLLRLCWSSDGTHVAAAGANGAVVFGQVVERRIEWANYAVALTENNHVTIHDVLNDGAVCTLCIDAMLLSRASSHTHTRIPTSIPITPHQKKVLSF